MTRKEACEALLSAKKAAGLSFADLATALGRDKVWVAAALMGQATLSEEEARRLGEALGTSAEVTDPLRDPPHKGALDAAVPVDPLVYRFHEITQVYGTAMKAVIHEMFGDGIMSAIDFEIDIRKQEDPTGDRVVVTYSGKFLPYRKW